LLIKSYCGANLMTRLSSRTRLFLLSILSTALLMSCSSTLPSLQNPDQTILIVVIESNNPQHVHSGIETAYLLNVPNCKENVFIKSGVNYAVGKSIPAGSYNFVYLTQRILETQGGGWSTGALNNVKTKMDVNFEVNPGYINFFPVKFIYTVTHKAGGAFSKWTFDTLTKADRENALINFRSNKNFNQWKVDL
jgi:hypothetical protein